jgi:hypothetical protein
MNFVEKKNLLPQRVKTYLESDAVYRDLEMSLFVYGLEESSMSSLSGQIGRIFVKDFLLSDLPKEIFLQCKVSEGIAFGVAYEINRRFFAPFPEYFIDAERLLSQWQSTKTSPVISEQEAYQKIIELDPWILEDEKEKQQEQKQKILAQQAIEKLTLLQALEKYARINDQQLTSERIRIRSERESVRGTVRNWLRSYRDAAGFGKHEAVTRGHFLFQSDNGKKLASDERERVALLLKMLDENEMLAVDGQKQVIIFPEIPQKSQEREVPLVPQSRLQEVPFSVRRSQSSFNFSSSKKNVEEKSVPTQSSLQVAPETFPVVSSKNPFRFSSGHILPSEKQEQSPSLAIKPEPTAVASFGLDFTPTQSTPLRKEVWQVPNVTKNSMNLPSDER